ncbi:hypothetical protein C1H46_040212 [Malus baccata]|uniref:Desiccation-related protein PCC13-62 n=1 Tax=Malus baccata TaxID=106549 RepID=A0A540KJ59_MALBA|nr:hypothetical protein C1H46_040212 [Malus baccata]
MATFAYATTTAIVFLILLPLSCSSESILHHHHHGGSSSVQKLDVDLLEFPLNLEYLEAEFFLYGSLGYGLDKVYPSLAQGGPSPIGAKKAHLDHFTRDVIEQFGWQEVGHLSPLNPPFDPYANSINYLLASYIIPYVGLTGYVGASPKLQGATSKRLVAGLLGVESGQDAVIRALLYQRAELKVEPYGITVAEFTNRISELRNKLGHEGLKDEGLVVPKQLGAEGKVSGNILAGDEYSLAYGRTPEEILRIVYGSGNERVPGGFYPKGADGRIAKSYLKKE